MSNITRRLDRIEDALTVEGRTRIIWLEPGQTAESVGAVAKEGERLVLASWLAPDQQRHPG